ncbi:DUF4124 domain-containing protein [Seongchinamella sediminis]|uniref:DUF4124 domain-containing protein n=1 Tax=Seongchinamella sediminis TaxID=2283635 RepID=A0A3L7DV32_9GAMM|nr:DUF4124 domain-containing protein [Seongchinamella sediminis]RLQ21428.1 DUF4124 domain-containing protein [Seongchinamella sediminis]
MPRLQSSTLFIATLLYLAPLSSEVIAGTTHYRWLNERGNPVHSDRPPPKGIDYEVITTGSGLKRVVAAEEGAVPAEATPRVGNEFEQQQVQEKNTVKNPEYCKRATENLETLTSAPRIRLRDEEGQFRFLSNEERETEIAKAEAAIATHCP